MIISGQKTLNFLNQTGDFGYDFSFTPDNYLGSFSFGISGNKNVIFNCFNGKIYDQNNNLIHGYTLDDSVNVKNIFGSGKQNLYINSNPIYLFQEYTGYNFNNFIIKTTDCNLEVNLNISGQAAILENKILTKRIKNLDTGATVPDTFILTGQFTNINSGLEVKIFDATVNTKTDLYSISGLPISFYQTGIYYVITNSGNLNVIEDTFNATFYTNFGNINYDINTSGQTINPIFSFLDIYPNLDNFDTGISGAVSGILIYPNLNEKFIISYGNYTGASVKVNLDYLSGITGIITGFLTGSGTYDGLYSGFLTGSGVLFSQIISPTIFSGERVGFNDILVTNLSGDYYTSLPFIATGYVEYNYSIIGTGLGTGYIYPNIDGSGFIFRKFSGYVPYLGGGILVSEVTGLAGTGAAYDDMLGNVNVTGILTDAFAIKNVLYTGLITGVNLNSNQYINKTFTFSPDVFNTDITGQKFTIIGTGYATGNYETGIMNPEFFMNLKRGYYKITKQFNNISGQALISENEKVITGWQNIISCKKEQFNFLLKGRISGTYTGYSFFDVCDATSEIPTGIVVSSYSVTGRNLYRITGKLCDEASIIPMTPTGLNFVIIRPTGVIELKNLNNESLEYLLSNSGDIRTRISLTGQNISGSGYFNKIFNDCGSYGIWEHVFSGATEKINPYLSTSWMNNFELNVVGKQDDGQSYFSEMEFQISGSKSGTQQYNFTLTNNNNYVSEYPAKESLYKFILYKKAITGFSGIYESNFVKLIKNQSISICTGLNTGEYLLRGKYIHKNTEENIYNLCCCRPIQILNILDTNMTNYNSYLDFYTIQNPRLSGFMKNGSGYHQVANYFYNEKGYSGHDFATGYNGPYSLYMTQDHTYADPTKELNIGGGDPFDNESITERNQAPFGFFSEYEYAVPWLPDSIKNNPSFLPYDDINTYNLTNWYNPSPYTRTGLSNVLKIIPTLKWTGAAIKQVNLITNRLDFPFEDKNKIIKNFSDLFLNSGIITNVVYSVNDSLNYTEAVPETFKDIANVGGGNLFASTFKLNNLNIKNQFTVIPSGKRILIPCDQVISLPLLSGAPNQPIAVGGPGGAAGGLGGSSGGPGECDGTPNYFGGINLSIITASQESAPTYNGVFENCVCGNDGTYKVNVALRACGKWCGRKGSSYIPVDVTVQIYAGYSRQSQTKTIKIDMNGGSATQEFIFKMCPQQNQNIYARAWCDTRGKDCKCETTQKKIGNSGSKGCKCTCPELEVRGCATENVTTECDTGYKDRPKIKITCPQCKKDVQSSS